MAFSIEPATAERFDDLVTVLGPKRAGAKGCWCLPYRLGHVEEGKLDAAQRVEYVSGLCGHLPYAPGLLAYDGPDVVGWTGVAPKVDMVEFATAKRYRHPDEEGVWVVWCFRVRAGHAGRGVADALLRGAVDHAAANGAPAIEGYPVDNEGQRVDRTLASFGVRAMFDREGFVKVAELTGRRAGFPQVLMRALLPRR